MKTVIRSIRKAIHVLGLADGAELEFSLDLLDTQTLKTGGGLGK